MLSISKAPLLIKDDRDAYFCPLAFQHCNRILRDQQVTHAAIGGSILQDQSRLFGANHLRRRFVSANGRRDSPLPRGKVSHITPMFGFLYR